MAITLTFTPVVPGAMAFRQGKLGGGGHTTGFDISPDGTTRLVTVDTTGCFFWSSPTVSNNPVTDTAGQWRNLWSNVTVPDYGGYTKLGFWDRNVYSAAVAHSNPLIVYAAWPSADNQTVCKLLKSTDRCATWNYTNYPISTLGQSTVNQLDRLYKPHMAVDPQNPNVVWLGRPAGEWDYTFDGGTTWATLSTAQIPLGANSGDGQAGPNPQIVFDRNSTLTSGRSSVIYIANGARGVYKSTNGGASFTAMAGGPTHIKKMRVDSLGRLYVLRQGTADTDDLFWLDGSTWTNSTVQPGNGTHLSGLAINPFDNNEIVVLADSGQMMRSTNRGVAFTAYYEHIPTRVIHDVTWFGYTNEDYFVNVDTQFDPIVNGRLWFCSGIGVYYYDRPTNFGVTSTVQVHHEHTRGIDGLIVMQLCKPPGGSLNFVVQDRVGFRITNPDVYPVKDGAPPIYGLSIRHGWSIDYAPNPAPYTTYMVRASSNETWGYSTNDGDTWTTWTSKTCFRGVVACSTPSNTVFFEGDSGPQYYTINGGTTWSAVTWKNAALATLSQSFFDSGFFGYYSERKPVCADKATAGTFYCYKNQGDNPDATYVGFYKSTDGGATFIRTPAAVIPFTYGSGSNHLKMAAVPGKAGHVFMATGYMLSGGGTWPDGLDLYFTNDGWATHQTGSFGFNTCVTVGFGKAAPGQTYPAVYVWGVRALHAGVTNAYGLFRCTDWDGARTWELLTGSYNGTLDRVRDVIGDLDVYGRVYLAYASTGYAVGELT